MIGRGFVGCRINSNLTDVSIAWLEDDDDEANSEIECYMTATSWLPSSLDCLLQATFRWKTRAIDHVQKQQRAALN